MIKHYFSHPNRIFGFFLSNEKASTAIEYALIASMLSIAILAGVWALTGGTGGMFGYILEKLSPALTGASR